MHKKREKKEKKRKRQISFIYLFIYLVKRDSFDYPYKGISMYEEYLEYVIIKHFLIRKHFKKMLECQIQFEMLKHTLKKEDWK